MQSLAQFGNFLGSLLVVPHRRIGSARLVWGVLASVSIACALALSLARSDGYWEVRHWLEVWRTGPTDVYAVRALGVDYPPHAMWILLPMMWLPKAIAAQVFAIFNTAACILSTWLLVSITSRLAGVKLSRAERGAYVLMFLAGTPVRVCIWIGQTTPLVLLLLCAAMRLADSFPILAGVCLGLGTFKPHASLGFLIVFAFQKRLTSLLSATVVVTGLVAAYCMSVGQSIPTVIGEYYNTLIHIYGGPKFLHGEVDMRPFFIDLLGGYGVAEVTFLVAAVVLAVMMIGLSWRARRQPGAPALILATGLVWSLAVFPFRRYGLLLMAPVILCLLWEPQVTLRTKRTLAIVIFSILIDVPFLIRHAMERWGSPQVVRLVDWTHYANRIAIVVFLSIALLHLARLGRPTVSGGALDVRSRA